MLRSSAALGCLSRSPVDLEIDMSNEGGGTVKVIPGVDKALKCYSVSSSYRYVNCGKPHAHGLF